MTGSFVFPRVQAIPQVGRASLCLDGVERVGYEFGDGGSRPFLYPLIGPSGAPLTRLGHPDPIGHEHHKSIWFGHESVAGINFWEERANTDIRIRHRCVRLYHDGPHWGGLVADLDWWAQGRSLLRHELTVVLAPGRSSSFILDIQSRFESSAGVPIELGRTNFGFLGVRVAKTISEQFGGGRLTDDRGSVGESSLFGNTSRWVDYSGPNAPRQVEGICLMDHPSNPSHPTRWHVRADGWMGPSFSADSPHGVAKDHPLTLRYRLLIHSGHAEPAFLNPAWDAFAAAAPYDIVPPRDKGIASLCLREVSA